MHAPAAIKEQTTYRPDIDGLRAIAVLSVLAYHYGAPLHGGFTGVDVFFVISGYLITSGLMNDIRSGRFSILGFYERRVRRIWPALIAMLACSMVAGNVLLMPGDYKDLSASAAAASIGASNFYFLWNTGYFDQRAEMMPLLHTWSLAVEEQFYLFWPPILFVIARQRRLGVIALLACLIVVGFAASILWFDYDPKSAFFNAVPRAWELALGALLVFAPPLNRAFGSIATIAGIAVILCGFVTIAEARFPGASALYPCVGAMLVIWPRLDKTRPADLLGFFSPIGLISYSLYLWHWPVLVFFRAWNNNLPPTPREVVALVVVSIAISTLSYQFVERPFRRRRFDPAVSVWSGLAASATIFVAAMAIHSSEGAPRRVPAQVNAMSGLYVMWDWPCQLRDLSAALPQVCTFGPDWKSTKRKAVLWGDSNAEHLAPFLKVMADRDDVAVALFPHCPAILDGKDVIYRSVAEYNKNCSRQNAGVESLIEQSPDISKIILAGSWSPLISVLDGGANILETSMSSLIGRLINAGKDVVLITTIPHWLHDPVPCALLEAGLPRRECDDSDRDLPKEVVDQANRQSNEIFSRLAKRFPKLRVIDPANGLCSSGQCVTQLNDEFLYRDQVHFRRNLSAETNSDLARLMGLERIFHPDN